jgi:hypothetical protein
LMCGTTSTARCCSTIPGSCPPIGSRSLRTACPPHGHTATSLVSSYTIRISIIPCSLPTLVTISLPKPSYTIIVLSQLDSRYYTGLSGQSIWTFDFALFKKGETEAIASSLHSRFYARSVNLEIDLSEGEYVVHVRLDRQVGNNVGVGCRAIGFYVYGYFCLGRHDGHGCTGLEPA